MLAVTLLMFHFAKTENKDCFNCLLDGELILHNKQGKFINLYAIFDIYYFKKDDVRAFPFMLVDKKSDIEKTRFYLLQYITNSIKAVSITNIVEKEASSVKSILAKFKQVDDLLSPIRIVSKEFYPMSNKQTIFNGCDIILSKV